MKKKKVKLLLVEDDEFISEIYQKKLSESGFDICLAKDGEEAVYLFKKNVPEVILLDIMLPKKNGLNVLSEIRKTNDSEKVKIIMLTNLGEKEKIQEAMEEGADDYLLKASLTPKELVEIIKDRIKF